MENLYQLTRNRKYELRVDLQDFEGVSVYAHYSYFSVESEADGYKLHVSGFTNGGAGENDMTMVIIIDTLFSVLKHGFHPL